MFSLRSLLPTCQRRLLCCKPFSYTIRSLNQYRLQDCLTNMNLPRLPVFTAEWVRVLGVNVRYFRLGKGPPIVLLHGLGESSIIWAYNIEPLAKSYTVYALDLPGHGHSDKPKWPYSLNKSVDFLSSFLSILNLERPHLIGNSLGGMIALETAFKQPNQLGKLVLVDSAGLGKELASFLKIMTLPLVGELMTMPTKAGLRFLLKQVVANPHSIPNDLIESLVQERNRKGNKRSMLRILRSGVNIRGIHTRLIDVSRLEYLNVPTYILWGREDKIFPSSHGQNAAMRLPRGRLTVFEDCGHWPQIEKHREFNRLVVEFLK